MCLYVSLPQYLLGSCNATRSCFPCHATCFPTCNKPAEGDSPGEGGGVHICVFIKADASAPSKLLMYPAVSQLYSLLQRKSRGFGDHMADALFRLSFLCCRKGRWRLSGWTPRNGGSMCSPCLGPLPTCRLAKCPVAVHICHYCVTLYGVATWGCNKSNCVQNSNAKSLGPTCFV